jgi:hypothetical protein
MHQLYDRETDMLTVLDVGLVTAIQPDMARQFGDFLRALVNLDAVRSLFHLNSWYQLLTHSSVLFFAVYIFFIFIQPIVARQLMRFHNPAVVAPGSRHPESEEVLAGMKEIMEPFQVCFCPYL